MGMRMRTDGSGFFGPTLAVEKLAARHGLRVGVETLRQWMMSEDYGKTVALAASAASAAGLSGRIGADRRLRACLVRGPWGAVCTLLAFVDDATSRLMTLRFVVSESAFDYFRTTRAYLETHGKPVAFYSDKHNIFRVNNGEGGNRVTQFGRALEALNIDIICANSPQAKGRVERAFGTLQDRLVKELRLAGISSIEAANAWLPDFIASHNARFGREPANAKDLHRKLTAADDLDEILAWREERTVTQNLTLHYDRMMLILEPTPLARGLVRRKVEVVNYPDGRFAVQCNGRSLPYRMFDTIQTVPPGTIVDNKRLSAVLAMVKARQAEYAPKRQRGHVARQRPPNNLDAPGLPSKGRASPAALAAAVT